MATVTMGTADEFMRLTVQGWPTEGHREAVPKDAPEQRYLKVELELMRLRAERVVDLTLDLDRLSDFFDDVVERWQGVELGEALGWESRERDFTIEALRVRPGGSPEHREPDYVELHVTLRDFRSWRADGWTVTAVLTIRPVGQLQAIARGVHVLAGALD